MQRFFLYIYSLLKITHFKHCKYECETIFHADFSHPLLFSVKRDHQWIVALCIKNVCVCACKDVHVCVQKVGMHKDLKQNPEVVHYNLTEETFNSISQSTKNPFNPLKIRSLY